MEDLTTPDNQYPEPTNNEKELISFIVDHTDRWRDWRDQNYLDDWDKYERIFRGIWSAEDKQRESERSRVISPATQQAVETRHAEVMEAIFGQGEYFDIKDDLNDANGSVDVEKIKNQLYEDFAQDKIKKSIDQIELMAEIYGTGIGEIIVGKETFYYPAEMPVDPQSNPNQPQQIAYGTQEKERTFVRLNPINPKNFLFDPNGTAIDDCMGVAIEKYTSIHKIAEGMAKGTYKKCDISSFYKTEDLEPTQELRQFQDDKVLLLTYYGLVPSEYLKAIETAKDEQIEELFPDSMEDYQDMVEAIVIIANGHLLKAEESPYMMKDRPVLSYQDDTVPNRLLGRGTCEKAFNMQMAVDASMRSHLDSLALTVAPMVAIDATRLPRGAKFEVKPGKAFMTNGAPQEILMPFNFGTNDGAAMNTSKEFERMLTMATGTLDSQGQVSQVSRDAGGLNPATSSIIKKYKRTLVNFQEDFMIPFVKKATWRYMQFEPERYPSSDVKFISTATLGILAREYEQQQLAFLVQTLGAQSPLTPILMQGIISSSSYSKREEMLEGLKKASQPDPQKQQVDQQQQMLQMQLLQAQIEQLKSQSTANTATAQKITVEAQLAPQETQAKVMNAISTNLPNDDAKAATEFSRRVQIADLMLKEENINIKKQDIASNERITREQMNKSIGGA